MMMPFAMKAQFNASLHIDTTVSACEEYTWSVSGITYTTSGAYFSYSGDTLYILDLTINPAYSNTIPIPVAGGCTFEWGDTTITTGGIYTKTFTSAKGCDSTVKINLSLSTSASRTYVDTVCGELEWKGNTYTNSGVYNFNSTVTSDPTSACDSFLTMNLTVIAPEQLSSYDTAIGCDRVRYRFMTSGASYIYFYADTDTNSDLALAGNTTAQNVFHPRTLDRCFDSVIYLHVIVKDSKYYNYTTSACDQFEMLVGDSNYVYTFSRLDSIKAPRAANGCDSTIILNLTIHEAPVVSISGDLRVAPNANATLYANCDQNVAYYWTYRNNQHSSADSITLTQVSGNEDVSLRATNTTSQCASTTYVTVMANASIANVDEKVINVYPNPTNARINIASEQAVKNVTLFNVNGQQLMTTTKTDIDLSQLSNGTYVVRVEMQDGTVATRTVVLSK